MRQIRYDCDGDALVALVEPAGSGLPHGSSARASTASSRGAPTRPRTRHRPTGEPAPAPPTRRWRCSSARCSTAADAGPTGSYTVELLDDPARIGDKVREEAEEVSRAAASESEQRVTEEAADVLYHLHVLLVSRGISIGGGAGDAQWPSPLSARRTSSRASSGHASWPAGQRDPGSDVVRRRLRDPRLRVPQAARRTAPASCSSPPSRDAWAATRSSASARARCCAGTTGVLSEWPGDAAPDDEPERATEAPDPYAAVSEYLGRHRLAPVEDLPPFAGGAVGFFGYDLVRTVEPLGEPNPDPIGLPDMALMVSDVLVVFDHMRHELTLMAYAFLDDESDVDAAYARAARRDRRRCASASAARCRRPPPRAGRPARRRVRPRT